MSDSEEGPRILWLLNKIVELERKLEEREAELLAANTSGFYDRADLGSERRRAEELVRKLAEAQARILALERQVDEAG